MPRSKHSVPSRKRRNKIIKLAKGNRGGRSKLLRTVYETVDRGLVYTYRDRKKRKSIFRKLWISRINAAVRFYGISYSQFMNKLKGNNISIDRKILAHLAANEPITFQNIINKITK